MTNQLKEYTGTGASGGNSTDGNNIPSPRPFIDDEAELNNYLEKNRYGGEGNHYRKDKAMPNPNRTRFTKFEETMKEGTWSTGTVTEIQRFLRDLKMLKDKYYNIVGDDSVFDGLDSAEKAATELMMNAPENRRDVDEADIFMNKKDFDKDEDYGEKNRVIFDDNIPSKNQYENKMKKSDLLKDYMSSRKGTNLNEQMEIHRKEAKRSVLMEGAMKQFFELFELGRTDEEIVLDYASKGVQVPESFVSKARGQYEGLKKMKLELDMSEKEFKNSAKDIVNNPDETVVNSENKPLSSGIYDA